MFSSSNKYDYQLEQEIDFESYRLVINSETNHSFFDNSNNSLSFEDDSLYDFPTPYGSSVKTLGKIISSSENKLVEDGYSIDENSIETIVKNYKSNNDIIENQFNFLGPVIIKNNLNMFHTIMKTSTKIIFVSEFELI